MALDIIDGNGAARTVKTSLDGVDHVPHHNVDTIAGVVQAAQSGGWSVSITGTLPVWTGALNIGKAEDDAHATGDVGVMALSVRSDTPGNKSADGDYHPVLVDSLGRIHTNNQRNGDAISVGSASLSVKKAFANIASATTDGAVVAAVTSKKIRVVGVAVVCGGVATTVTFNTKPGGAGSAISATFALVAGGVLVLPSEACGWFETASGEGLSATTGVGSTVGIQVIYAEV